MARSGKRLSWGGKRAYEAIIQSDKDVPQFEAVALIYEERRPEPNLLSEEPENKGAQEAFPLRIRIMRCDQHERKAADDG
jgi:hypothetical protein